jgi:hypothetical protein
LVIEELNRRAVALSEAMAELAQENMCLSNAKGAGSLPSARGASSSGGAEKQLAAEREANKRRLAELEAQLSRQAAQLHDTEAKLRREEQQRQAYADSNGLYEKKVLELEEKMADSLAKESQRRQAAELSAKRLKQRVKELQDDDDDDDDDSADQEEDKGG